MAAFTFGGGLWGGGSGGTPLPPGVPVADLIYEGLRIAGITDRPGRGPSTDQINDVFPLYKRMVGSWNCAGLNSYSTGIETLTLVPGQKVYTIGGPGLGADFNVPRPQKIANAVLGFSQSPIVRMPPMYLMSADEWANVSLQDVPNTIPLAMFYNPTYEGGLGKIYLWGQAGAAYQLELYVWGQISEPANAQTVVSLPPGYELAITFNLALMTAMKFPTQQQLTKMGTMPEVRATAHRALAAIQSLNSVIPKMVTDAPGMSEGLHFDWRTGINR